MYTPLGPAYGTIPGPGGDLLVSPDDARRLGFEPPSFTPPDSPVPDGALAMPPPDPMDAAPTIAPVAPVSLAPTPADQPGAPAPVDPYPQAAPPPPPQAAAPAEAPVSNLSATTYADVLGEQRAAMGAQVKAAATTAELQAQQAEQEAKAIEDRNAAIAAKEDEYKAREADDQKRIADTTALYEAKVKEFAAQYEIEVLLRRFFDEYLVPTLSKKNITDPSWHRNHNPTMSEPHLFLEKTMSNELSIFYKSTKKNSLIFTDSINHKEIKMLFDFIYQNQVKITKIRHKLKP